MAKLTTSHKTYIEFVYPGAFFNENEVRAVKSRNIDALEVPNGAFAFRFFDLVTMKTRIGKENFSKRNKVNVSPLYYYGGRVLTFADVKKEMPNAYILISNMISNGLKKVIKTRCGNFQPFEKDDILIVPKKTT